MLSSLLILSGAVQFAAAGALVAGASIAAILATAVMLNARNLLLGAALRSRLQNSRPARAGLAWFLLDESAGLALTAKRSSGRVLLTAGLLCYFTWGAGTVVGVVGASLASLEISPQRCSRSYS